MWTNLVIFSWTCTLLGVVLVITGRKRLGGFLVLTSFFTSTYVLIAR